MRENLLLKALPQAELDDPSNGFEQVALPLNHVLFEKYQPITEVYFVLKGVVSMVNETSAGEIVEIATIGPEGMVGIPLLLDSDTMPSRAMVQIPGDAIRMPGPALKKLVGRHAGFRSILLRSTLALMNQMAQSSSCNRLHEVQERCARWLLHTLDRVKDPTFPLTQEFLGQMLGVQRPSVSIAARMLQQAGLISYTRGSITVLDRGALEQAACECYRTIKGEYDRLLAGQAG